MLHNKNEGYSKTFYVKYIGIIDGKMGILTRKENISPARITISNNDFLIKRPQTVGLNQKPQKNKDSNKSIMKKINGKEILLSKPVISLDMENIRPHTTTNNKSRNLIIGNITKKHEKNINIPEFNIEGKNTNLYKMIMKPFVENAIKNIRPQTTSSKHTIKFDFNQSISFSRALLNMSRQFQNKTPSEFLTGIPNPQKYQTEIITNSITHKKPLITYKKPHPSKFKDYASVVNVQCTPSREGVTGAKIVRNRQKMCKSVISTRPNFLPFDNEKPKRVTNYDLYKNEVFHKLRLRKRNLTYFKSLSTNQKPKLRKGRTTILSRNMNALMEQNRKSLCISINTKFSDNNIEKRPGTTIGESTRKNKRHVIYISHNNTSDFGQTVFF